MSLADIFNNFMRSLRPDQRKNLNLRSCGKCAFFKLGMCTQVQPPSTVVNEYDAQVCIYYTPETVTTGQITQTERTTQASQLDRIGKIGVIEEIETIRDIQNVRQTIIANPMFQQGWTGWQQVGDAEIVHSGVDYYVKFEASKNYTLKQEFPIPIPTDKLTSLRCMIKSPNAGVNVLKINLHYSDMTSSANYLSAINPNVWEMKTLSLDAGKTIDDIEILHFDTYPESCFGWLYTTMPTYWNDVNVLTLPHMGREDVDWLYFSNTFAGAADYAILAGVSGQKHKVYAFDYESSADVEVRIRDGTGARAFGVRTTKGVLAQTFINPFVGTANTALNLRAEGVTTVKGFISYKTEA